MICEIDGRVLGGMQFGVLVQVLLELAVAVWARFCKIEGRVLGGMQFRVLVQCFGGAGQVLSDAGDSGCIFVRLAGAFLRE